MSVLFDNAVSIWAMVLLVIGYMSAFRALDLFPVLPA